MAATSAVIGCKEWLLTVLEFVFSYKLDKTNICEYALVGFFTCTIN